MKRLLSLILALVMVLALLPAQVFAAGADATVTVSGSSYRGKYVVISDGSDSKLYYINSTGTVENTDGTAAAFGPGSYTVYYGITNAGSGRVASSSFATGRFTVAEEDSSATVRLSTARVSNRSADVYLYATSSFYNTVSFDHVDVRVEGSYVIHVGTQEYTARVSDPTVVVKVGGSQVAKQSWTNSNENYEWRQTGLSLTKSQVITVELTLDLTYTDSSGQTHVLEDVRVVYDSVNNPDQFIDAIAICDMVQGLDFRVAVEDIEEEIQYHAVTYEWSVYNTDGTYTELPAGAPGEPASSAGHESGTLYTYDTEYVTGTSFYDYDSGLLYTFHGWDTYSHSAVYNPVPTSGYYALDDGDTDPDNNPAIEITDDTYIYGYWTVTELPPASAHIAIEKVFLVDGVQVPMAEAQDLWFRIDTGIDRDGDGETQIDVDYPMIAAATGGEYKIPVYQYETPFVFTEHNAEVPGYTRTTTITVSGAHITEFKTDGDAVTVTMDPVYEGENVHLGTVTYTNAYTKNVGTPMSEYPTLTLVKTASDTHSAQSGVVFTLYADGACTEAITTVTTGDGGLAFLDFSEIENMAAGTYYLKETAPLEGYIADPYTYALTLAVSETREELRDNAFVQVTYHTLTVTVPEGSTASHQEGSNRLHIYNAPVLGNLNILKAVTGMDDAHKNDLEVIVIVHGPITRDGQQITGIGSTWELELSSENNWQAAIERLPLGEYMIHESFASVHGYTWTGVTYGDLTEKVVYNGIESYMFKVTDDTPISLILTNAYEEWTAADFFIRKLDEDGHALAGATFALFTDLSCTVPATGDFTEAAVTGADGYAHFVGYTVPEGQESVTYYLRETQAPAGYYLSDQVYQVVIRAVNAEGKTTYEPTISLVAGRSSGFDIATDLLTVINYPVRGKLTVTKAFTGGFIPEGLTELSVHVGGPNGYSRTVKLSGENAWSVTLEDLALGTYTVTELDADVPGYTWEAAYSSSAVTLAEAMPGSTAPGTEISGFTTITNTYTRNDAFYEVPAVLTVKKVGEEGEALAGAVFTMDRLDKDGASVLSSVSFTTGTDGTVVFDLLFGFAEEDGSISEGVYVLSETQAPEGYEKTDATWTVTIREDDGQLRVELNENRNVFEHFWDWIVGDVRPGVWADGVLQVTNYRTVAVDVTKVWNGAEVTHPETVDVTLYRDGEVYDTVTLSADCNWSHSWEGLSNAYTWTVDEPSVPSGYNKTVDRNGYSFTITNTHEDIPKTGDMTNLLGSGMMTAVGITGFGASLAALFAPRKKKKDEQEEENS